MKHYLISKTTPRQHKETVFINNNDFKRAMEIYVQSPDGWIIPASVSDLHIHSDNEDHRSGLYSNEPYTMTGEVVITREQQVEILRELVRI